MLEADLVSQKSLNLPVLLFLLQNTPVCTTADISFGGHGKERHVDTFCAAYLIQEILGCKQEPQLKILQTPSCCSRHRIHQVGETGRVT